MPFTPQSTGPVWQAAESATPLQNRSVGASVGRGLGATVATGVGVAEGVTVGEAVVASTQVVDDDGVGPPVDGRVNPGRHSQVYALLPTGSAGVQIVLFRSHTSVPALQWFCVGAPLGTAVGNTVGAAVGAALGFIEVGATGVPLGVDVGVLVGK